MADRTIPISTARITDQLQLHTILVPCDFAAASAQALRWAVELAAAWEAKLLVLHVLPVFSLPTDLPARLLLAFPQLETALVRETQTRLEAWATQNTRSTVPVDLRVVLGDAWWEICKTAEREAVDLIVMGSRSDTGVPQIFLGSVAERVMRHAPCPVLVVRLPRQPAGGKDTDVVP